MQCKSKLFQPVFILSIFILIINDFILKKAFHNDITGKLSDFAGLFAFPFFWSAIFPNKTKEIHLSTIVLFIFWKSELSQSLIDFTNTIGFNTFRVVDYTDNIALISVLISYLVISKPTFLIYKPALTKLMLIVSVFSFVATTQKREFRAPTYEEGFKTIRIENFFKEPALAIVNFKYNDKELEKDTSLNNKFNRVDSVKIEPNQSVDIIIPIKKGDSLQFPSSFKISILDTLGKQRLKYNKDAFLKLVEKDFYNKKPISEFSEEWHLKVGFKEKTDLSTLYGRWSTDSTSKRQHTFEIRADYYYDVNPDGDVKKYIIRDSVIIVDFDEKVFRGKILHLKNQQLTIKWNNDRILKYNKLYN